MIRALEREYLRATGLPDEPRLGVEHEAEILDAWRLSRRACSELQRPGSWRHWPELEEDAGELHRTIARLRGEVTP